MVLPLETLSTARLALLAPMHVTPFETLDFYLRNDRHFAPWGPPLAPDFLSLVGQARRLEQSVADFRVGAAFRYWLIEREGPRRIIGQMNFSQVSRGAFQNTMLGYNVDREREGKGLMREALRAGLDEMFSERGRLHRVQANIRPENTRSVALIERLGFEREGLSKRYLFIDGDWRDHYSYALRSPVERPIE